MKSKPIPAITATPLRRRAELRLRKISGENKSGAGAIRTTADTQRLLHELQVHQIELEMQNEELMKARDEIEQGLERYSDLYDFAPVGYLTLDREGAIREANLTAASLLGIPRGQLVKQHLAVFAAPPDHPIFDAFLQRVFAGEDPRECDVQLRMKDRPAVDVRMRANLFGSGQACRVTMSDITAHKLAEADRLVLKKLESTGILAGGIAHDFNNLLTVILLNLELARMRSRAEVELTHILDDAEKAVLLAHDLTQQIITFAEGGAPNRASTQLAGVIKEAVRLALNDSSLSCEFSVADGLWLVEADNRQIGQVIQNMILNAREAMPEGGVISVRMENVVLVSRNKLNLPAGQYVRASIADQGGGIAQEVLPRIFDPYFSTKKRGQQRGMGLGLTISHSVVRKHGGAIAVETEAGKGTTFHLYLPAFERGHGLENSTGATSLAPDTKNRAGNLAMT